MDSWLKLEGARSAPRAIARDYKTSSPAAAHTPLMLRELDEHFVKPLRRTISFERVPPRRGANGESSEEQDNPFSLKTLRRTLSFECARPRKDRDVPTTSLPADFTPHRQGDDIAPPEQPPPDFGQLAFAVVQPVVQPVADLVGTVVQPVADLVSSVNNIIMPPAPAPAPLAATSNARSPINSPSADRRAKAARVAEAIARAQARQHDELLAEGRSAASSSSHEQDTATSETPRDSSPPTANTPTSSNSAAGGARRSLNLTSTREAALEARVNELETMVRTLVQEANQRTAAPAPTSPSRSNSLDAINEMPRRRPQIRRVLPGRMPEQPYTIAWPGRADAAALLPPARGQTAQDESTAHASASPNPRTAAFAWVRTAEFEEMLRYVRSGYEAPASASTREQEEPPSQWPAHLREQGGGSSRGRQLSWGRRPRRPSRER